MNVDILYDGIKNVLVNSTTLSWILMNSFWMLSDFNTDMSGLIILRTVFMITGIIFICLTMIKDFSLLNNIRKFTK